MVKWFSKLLKRKKGPISSKFDSILRPLHYQKCMADLRHTGFIMNTTQPVFISELDLAPADVLFCAGDALDPFWSAISYGSSGDYVHVAVYTGDGIIVEACGEGVVAVELANLIARYPYVVAGRCPGTKPNGVPELIRKVVEFCHGHVNANTPYNLIGALQAPLNELKELRHLDRTKRPYISTIKSQPKTSLFCSELVIEAYIYGGYIMEGTMNSASYSPTALAEDRMFRLVGYFGSLEMKMYIRDNDYFLTGGIPRYSDKKLNLRGSESNTVFGKNLHH